MKLLALFAACAFAACASTVTDTFDQFASAPVRGCPTCVRGETNPTDVGYGITLSRPFGSQGYTIGPYYGLSTTDAYVDVGGGQTEILFTLSAPVKVASFWLTGGSGGTARDGDELVQFLDAGGNVLGGAAPGVDGGTYTMDPVKGSYVSFAWTDDAIAAIRIDGGVFGAAVDDLSLTAAPEPFSFALAGVGLCALAVWGRRGTTIETRG